MYWHLIWVPAAEESLRSSTERRSHWRRYTVFLHNFSTLNGRAYWNIVSLYEAMKEGMRLCKEPLSGVGFDTWGVDCGMIDREGNLLGVREATVMHTGDEEQN